MTETPSWTDFNRHLRAYVARRVDAAFVDDILGDILLRVAEHRDQFDTTDNPLAWLYRVAGNLITDHYRRRAAERQALQQAGTGIVGATAPEDNAAYEELARCLVPMIRELPSDYRDALLMTDIEGGTQADAAAKIGLSVSGMKSRVQRGRDKLKQALHRCCEIEVNSTGRLVGFAPRNCTAPCCGQSIRGR